MRMRGGRVAAESTDRLVAMLKAAHDGQAADSGAGGLWSHEAIFQGQIGGRVDRQGLTQDAAGKQGQGEAGDG
jgi:hypothetical protein